MKNKKWKGLIWHQTQQARRIGNKQIRGRFDVLEEEVLMLMKTFYGDDLILKSQKRDQCRMRVRENQRDVVILYESLRANAGDRSTRVQRNLGGSGRYDQ